MPPTTFEDDDAPAHEVGDPDGVLNGTPSPTMPAPAVKDTDPPPAQRRPSVGARRRSKLAGPRLSPQQKNERAAARAQGLPEGEKPEPVPEDSRDARVWWERVLQEEFVKQGFAPSDARLYVYREKALARAGEQPVQLPPTIFGNQVLGHANQTAGDSLVELIMLRYHMGDGGARGPAVYKIKCMNANPANNRWVGGYATLYLENPADIEQRLRRIEAFEKATPARPDAQPAPYLPRLPQAPVATPGPFAPGAPLGPAPTAAASPDDFMRNMYQQMFDEFMQSWRTQKLAQAAPPPVVDEDARMAKQAQYIVEALVLAGVVQPKGTQQPATAATAASPRMSLIDEMYEREKEEDKLHKVIEGRARRMGMIRKDELPDVEVPAGGAIVEDDETAKRQEGEGVMGHMFRTMAEGLAKEFAKDPAKVIGQVMNSPIGEAIKQALLKSGMGLPTVGIAPGVSGPMNGGGGFNPTT